MTCASAFRPGVIAALCAASAFGALVGGTKVASADTFTYSSYSVPGEQDIQITKPNDIYGGMGQIDLSGTLTTGSGPGQNIVIQAWCLDVYTYLLGNGYDGSPPSSPPFTYNVTQLTTATENAGFSLTGTNNTAKLSQTQIDDIGALIAYGNANINNANVSAATQLAIWETEYGQTNGQPNFTFTGVSSATISQANTEIMDLASISSANLANFGSDVGLLTQGTSAANQTLAFFNPGPNGGRGVPGPLAGSGVPGVLLLGGLAALIWQRRKRAPTALAV